MKIQFKPFVKQMEHLNYLFDKTTKELYSTGGAGASKSFVGAAWITMLAISRPGTAYVVGRATLTSIKKSCVPMFFEVFKHMGVPKKIYEYNAAEITFKFFNGSIIYFIEMQETPSDPEFQRFGSIQLHAALIDEAAQITLKAKNILKSRIRQLHTEFNTIPKLLVISNPNRSSFVYDIYQQHNANQLPEDVKYIHSTVYDNPIYYNVETGEESEYIKSLKTLDFISQKRLLDGSFEYSEDVNSLFIYNEVLECFENPYFINDNKHYLTCDVGGEGTTADKTVAIVWHGLAIYKIIEITGKNTTELSEEIKQLMKSYMVNINNVIVDGVGIGKGVVDQVRCRNFNGGSKPINPIYANLKTECFYRLSELCRDRKVSFPQSHQKQILKELDAIKKEKVDVDGKLFINDKKNQKQILGHSPDYADSISMRVWFELQPKSNTTIINLNRR